MNTIEIFSVADEIFNHKGFDETGCYGSVCQDACCRKGCDVDKESHELILKHRNRIEAKLGVDINDCFEKTWSAQQDFLGGNSISSTILNGSCAFHLSVGKGCVLFQLILQENCPWRMLPSTCRLYPLTWDNGIIHLTEPIEKTCNCLAPINKSPKTLWETQKNAIDDIFALQFRK